MKISQLILIPLMGVNTGKLCSEVIKSLFSKHNNNMHKYYAFIIGGAPIITLLRSITDELTLCFYCDI